MRAIDADALREKFADILNKTYIDDYAKGFVAGLCAALDMPTLTPPSDGKDINVPTKALGQWVSVEEAVPDPGERVIATDGIFVGEAYRTSANSWHRYDAVPWRNCFAGRTVRFWRPMPEWPEGEEEATHD